MTQEEEKDIVVVLTFLLCLFAGKIINDLTSASGHLILLSNILDVCVSFYFLYLPGTNVGNKLLPTRVRGGIGPKVKWIGPDLSDRLAIVEGSVRWPTDDIFPIRIQKIKLLPRTLLDPKLSGLGDICQIDQQIVEGSSR